MPKPPHTPPTPRPPEGVDTLRSLSDLTRALCQAALETWRLARLVPRLCEEDRARVLAIADRLSADLEQARVVIQDHTGHAYVEGLAVEILTTEDRTDLPPGALQIVETVRPSVYIAGQLAAQGQVILGRGVAEPRRTDGSLND